MDRTVVELVRVGGIAVVAAALLAPFASTAVAESGCGTPGRPVCTVLRPVAPTISSSSALGAGDCVIEVGGLGSTSEETRRAFEGLVADLDGVRVETLEYDTLGKIAAAANELRHHIRSLAEGCAAIHVVAHSMGGVVADRAFSMGLSSADRIATYVPLASPHNGASAARRLCGIGEVDPGYSELLRHVAELLGQADPTAPAICDLARVKPPRPPRGVSTARLRLVTDPIVLRRDHAARYRDVRELLPAEPAELEGHGGILQSAHASSVVRRSIQERGVPADDRSAAYRAAAAAISVEAEVALAVAHHEIAAVLWDGAMLARLETLAREVLEEVRSYVVVTGPMILAYLGSAGPAILPK